MAIKTSLHPLNRADGSAIYTSPNGYTILAAVNGPVEVQRRDELPEEAHIEVNVRPHDGVGQVKERHLEVLITNTLRDVVFIQMFPRQMVQLTLQILRAPVDDNTIGRPNPQAESVSSTIFNIDSLS
jgi:exosome complex component RRP46